MPQPSSPRERWVEAGLAALAGGGPQAVRVEALARELGVTKGGFYWHFADRAALLEAVLDAWERRVLDEVVEQVDAGGGDARHRLRRLTGLAATRAELGRVDLAVRIWARGDEAVAARLARVDAQRLAYLRALFAEMGAGADDADARCLVVMSLFVAGPFLAAEPLTRPPVARSIQAWLER